MPITEAQLLRIYPNASRELALSFLESDHA